MTVDASTKTKNPSAKKRTSLVTYLILLILVTVFSVWMLVPYLLAIMTGVICTLITHPLFRWFCKKGFGPKISAGLTTTILTLVLIGPVAGFIVAAVDEGISFSRYVTGDTFPSFEHIAARVTSWKPIESLVGDSSAVQRQMRSGIQTGVKTVTSAVLGILGNVPELALQLFLVTLTVYFGLLDGRRGLVWLKERIPMERDVREKLSNSFRDTAISSIWATMAAAGVQAGVMLAAFLILQVPAAFLATGATFIFSWIPILGSTPVWLAGSVYLYTQGSVTKAIFMVAFGILCSVSDNIVRPIILKGRDDMHPLISLLSIFGGIYFFGILGVFFGPILIAILLSLLNIWPAVAGRFGLLDRT